VRAKEEPSTHTGLLMDATRPTGRTLTLPGASFTQVEGDKIRYERVYTDRQTVTEQLGFTPKKT
jgi:predicted ester cyclase